ncbi:MAG: TetR/AcrR family transcriptional regulator [Candidatus Lokiarchaeota archaeon]|nr:TetR/AcrR family transcriptional regulator [Candidatus Lokiarchaeota archaeon]
MSVYLFINMRLRDEKKQDAIIKKSIQLVNDLGFSGISISKIAEEAGVSPATIYIYYKNKEDLFTKIYIDIRNKMSQASLQGVDDSKAIKAQFKSIWYNFFTYNLQHNDHLVYREHYEQTSMMNNIRQEDFELFKQVTNLLKKGIEENLIQNQSLPFLTAFAFMPIITLLKFNSEGMITLDDNLIHQASEIAWNAVKIYNFKKREKSDHKMQLVKNKS